MPGCLGRHTTQSPYDVEGGYGQILDAVASGIEYLAQSDHREPALQLAGYTIERAEAALEKFAEGWDWQCAMDRLSELVEKLKAASPPD